MSENQFIDEVKKLGISLTEDQLQKLESFYQILIKTNQTMNLTRITKKEEVYLKHFYDSLTLIKVVDLNQKKTLCDVGSGAGFPGIVLKIVFPDIKITLIDALQKRVNYLNMVIKELGLKDIEAIHIRSEEHARNNREKYDIVTARAVANLKKLSELTIPMVKLEGIFVAMKANAKDEINESQEQIQKLGAKIEEINEFILPIEESTRTLIKIRKIHNTDKKYPRKNLK